MYEDMERISRGLRGIYESIRDDEMQRHRIKEVHQIIRGLRGVYLNSYTHKDIEPIWYDDFQREYHLVDMMMRSIVARQIRGFDNDIATVYLICEDRSRDKLFVYHDRVEDRFYLIYSEEGYYKLTDRVDEDNIDFHWEKLIHRGSGLMIAHRSGESSKYLIEIKLPKVDEAMEEWQKSYIPMPSMCCSTDKFYSQS